MKKILLSLLILSTVIFAFEQTLFEDIDFFDDKYQKDYYSINLYELTGNPALMKLAYQDNLSLYQFSGGKKFNAYHRYFDNDRTENINLDLVWNRHLSEKSFLASGVKYYHSYQINVERSLEKDYYEHYFSITDTTNGDITYQGPKLFILFNQNINDNLFWGLDINYGVERGLKDIYTRSETIMRDFDASPSKTP